MSGGSNSFVNGLPSIFKIAFYKFSLCTIRNIEVKKYLIKHVFLTIEVLINVFTSTFKTELDYSFEQINNRFTQERVRRG